jgi:RND family efflux transporter MFP subunit
MRRLSILCLLISVCATKGAAAQDSSILCQINPSARIELASQAVGVTEQVMVDRGDKVVVGQPVAQLRADLERVQLALAQARANDNASLSAHRFKLSFANRKLERNAGLASGNLVSANDLDAMRTDRDIAGEEVDAALQAQKQAQIELEKARIELEMRTIRSPVAGIVTERRVEPGDLVRDQPVVVLERIDPLYVEVALPVALMGKVKANTEATIDVDVPDVPPVVGKVAVADRVIDAASNTFSVRIVMANPDGSIPAGSKCHVRFGEPTQ